MNVRLNAGGTVKLESTGVILKTDVHVIVNVSDKAATYFFSLTNVTDAKHPVKLMGNCTRMSSQGIPDPSKAKQFITTELQILQVNWKDDSHTMRLVSLP